MEFKAHNRYLLSLAISPDGILLASGDIDGNVYLWDLQTGAKLNEIRYQTTKGLGITQLAFKPDGSKLAVGVTYSLSRGITEIYDTDDWRIVSEFKSNEVFDLFWSPDNKYLAIASEKISVIDAHTNSILKEFKAHESWQNCVAFTPESSKLLTAGDFYDPSVKLWNVPEFSELVEVPDPTTEDDTPDYIDFFEPISILYLSNTLAVINDGYGVIQWDFLHNTLTKLLSYPIGASSYPKVAVSPNANFLAYESIDHKERIWRERSKDQMWARQERAVGVKVIVKTLDSGEELFTFDGFGDSVTSIIFDRESTRLITGDFEGYINIWDLTKH